MQLLPSERSGRGKIFPGDSGPARDLTLCNRPCSVKISLMRQQPLHHVCRRKEMMRRHFITIVAIIITAIVAGPLDAMNSLVGPDDMEKMRAAKIDNSVIQTLAAEQTCSVTGEFLIKLKAAGADDSMLKSVIMADRYKNPQKAELSTGQAETLRKAGVSDEAIMRMMIGSPVRRVVDEHGNETVVYGDVETSEPDPGPESESHGTFNINIEKVEKP